MPLHPLAPTNYKNEKWGVRITGPQAQPSVVQRKKICDLFYAASPSRPDQLMSTCF